MNALAAVLPTSPDVPAALPRQAVPWQALLGQPLGAGDGQALDAIATERRLGSDDWVFGHRSVARSLVALLEGTVSLGLRDGMAMAPERLLHGPAWLDAASAWTTGAPHTLDARALTSVRVIELPRRELQALIGERPALATAFVALLAHEVQRLSLQAHELMHKDAGGRLAAWLQRQLLGAQTRLRLAERKRDIAAQLGMSPETLSRQMRELSRRGLIEVRGYEVHVLDGAALKQLAMG